MLSIHNEEGKVAPQKKEKLVLGGVDWPSTPPFSPFPFLLRHSV